MSPSSVGGDDQGDGDPAVVARDDLDGAGTNPRLLIAVLARTVVAADFDTEPGRPLGMRPLAVAHETSGSWYSAGSIPFSRNAWSSGLRWTYHQ
jgi:hypothetical protein